ncbi:MAG TPA: 23S rRNA (pseudouridine(1915)-N(3))-methyltransferase RlmH [Gemmatimonadales bacterium]|nr:23S rRNA (pseudouridine(1915)-N(3))-methyltransferase RlmH [Gemmatimonadales bacterium]
METRLLAVGKLRPYFREACDDYLRRLSRYGPVEEREVRDAARAATADLRIREESARLAAALPGRCTVVLLDREGSAWSSESLAARLDRWRTEALPVALVVGGAWGVTPDLRRRAQARWSLGPLTLPHELARVVVLEQWYRAWTILRGEPYHRGRDT